MMTSQLLTTNQEEEGDLIRLYRRIYCKGALTPTSNCIAHPWIAASRVHLSCLLALLTITQLSRLVTCLRWISLVCASPSSMEQFFRPRLDRSGSKSVAGARVLLFVALFAGASSVVTLGRYKRPVCALDRGLAAGALVHTVAEQQIAVLGTGFCIVRHYCCCWCRRWQRLCSNLCGHTMVVIMAAATRSLFVMSFNAGI